MTLIIDGNCGFCHRCASWAQRHAVRPLEVVTQQSLSDETLSRWGVDRPALLAAVGRYDGTAVLLGAPAVAAQLRASRGAWPLVGVVLDAPIARIVARFVYGVIARNRSKFPGSTCSLEQSHVAE